MIKPNHIQSSDLLDHDLTPQYISSGFHKVKKDKNEKNKDSIQDYKEYSELDDSKVINDNDVMKKDDPKSDIESKFCEEKSLQNDSSKFSGDSNEDKNPHSINENISGQHSTNGTKDKQEEKENNFRMPEGRCTKFFFVIFYPVHVLTFFCLPNIRYKPNLSKVLLNCITLLLLQIFFALG